MTLNNKDPLVSKLIEKEKLRQAQGLELIPSENYVSRAVLNALGSEFTNKYSEGYPGKRYYGGQEYTDELESIAIDRAKSIFKSDHVNVQPHSGAPANEAAFWSWCEPGDTILAMDLSHGGHLTHGHPVTVLSKIFNFVRYQIKDLETGELDYEQIEALAKEHSPKIILTGFSSYPREVDYEKFSEIARMHGAVAMADIAHLTGLIAAGVLDNPFDYGFNIVTATTHKTLRGPRGGLILSKGKVSNPLKKPEKKIENIPTLIDRTVFPGLQGGPHMNTIAAKAVALKEAETDEFKEYAKNTLLNAKELSKQLQQFGFKLVTNGTDNHLILIDMASSKDINGKEAEEALDKVGLNVNKNVIPNDARPAYDPSGIRLGTPAMTTRGLLPEHMEQIATWINEAIESRRDEDKLIKIKREVKAFVKEFPIPSLRQD